MAPDHRPVPSGSGVVARLRLWSQLWQRYASAAHLDVSGADALRAREASGRRAGRPPEWDTWRLEA